MYEEAGEALHAFAQSLLEDPNDADDAVQQAVKDVLEGETASALDLRPYLFVAVRNAAFRLLRDRDRRVRKSIGWWEFRVRDPGKDNDRHKAVRFAVSQLPPDIRDVVVLHRWSELTLEKCAEILAIPKTTAEFRFRQAKDLLRSVLRVAEED